MCGDGTPVWSDPGPALLEGSRCMAPALQTSFGEVGVVDVGRGAAGRDKLPCLGLLSRAQCLGLGPRAGRGGGLCRWGLWPLEPPPPPSTEQAPRLGAASLSPDLQLHRGFGSWAWLQAEGAPPPACPGTRLCGGQWSRRGGCGASLGGLSPSLGAWSGLSPCS